MAAAAPSYSPIVANTLAGGSNGVNVTGVSGVGNGMQYSNDITGPFGESTVAKVSIDATEHGYGGWVDLNAHNLTNTNLTGTDLWIRVYHYFPSSFCAGFDRSEPEGDDGYGSTKWMRLNWANSGAHMTYQLSEFSNSACTSTATSPTVGFVSLEGFLDGGAPGFYWVTSPPLISRNTWHALQWHVHFGTTEADSFIRLWIDDTFIEQPPKEGATISAGGGSDYIDALVFGDYWNGGAHQNTAWYIANLIVSRETPSTTDAGGRPYISPSANAADF